MAYFKKLMLAALIQKFGKYTIYPWDQELTDNTASDLRRIWRSMKTDDLTCSLSRETATLTTNNLDITDALSNQKLALIQTNSAISDENICVKSWKILSNPLANQPDIKLKTSFKTIQSNLNKECSPISCTTCLR